MYLENVIIDARDPQRLGRFWETALGAVGLTDTPEGYETRLSVGDRSTLHLDVRLETGDDSDGVGAAIVARGGRALDLGWGEVPWRVYADPSGNEFCVLPAPR